MTTAAIAVRTCTTCQDAMAVKGHLCVSCYAVALEVAAFVGFPADDLTARRFLQRVNMNGPDPGTDEVYGPCWEWTGADNGSGYGSFKVAGRAIGPHVYAYSAVYGSPPDGMVVDHLCHVRRVCTRVEDCPHRRCVNPEHLRARSQRENLLRGNTDNAARAAQTHCGAGHPLSGENLYRPPGKGTRECRTCRRVASARSDRMHAAAKRAQRDLMSGQTALHLPGLAPLR